MLSSADLPEGGSLHRISCVYVHKINLRGCVESRSLSSFWKAAGIALSGLVEGSHTNNHSLGNEGLMQAPTIMIGRILVTGAV